ncbi:MAG: cadherin-like beta sandwich domain-containing protein, partial [Ruthenibacterium sp.]
AAAGQTQVGGEDGYIKEINGLGEFDGGSMSGWMGTLNDWLTDAGLPSFTVADGSFGTGDEVRIMYTCNMGADIGVNWGDSDQTLKSLTCSEGTLSPAFAGDVREYTLTVPQAIHEIIVTPTAVNRVFQVHTRIGKTEYKRAMPVPVQDGTVLHIKCGDPVSPGMDDSNVSGEVYTVTIAQKAADAPLQDGSVRASEIKEDGTQGAEITLLFDEKTQTFSGDLSAFTHLKPYNTSGIAVELKNVAAGSKAVLKVADKSYSFENNKASTGTDKLFTLPQTYACTIAILSESGKEQNYPLVLTKKNEIGKLTKCQLDGTPAFTDVLYGELSGTLFQLDANGQKTGKTGLADDCFDYKIYVSADTENIRPKAPISFLGTQDGITSLYADGKAWIANCFTMMSLSMKFKNKPVLTKNDSTKMELVTVSDIDAKQEIRYTFTVEKVSIDAEPAKIDTARLVMPANAQGDVFSPDKQAYVYTVGLSEKNATMEFTAAADTALYQDSYAPENALVKNSNGMYTVSFPIYEKAPKSIVAVKTVEQGTLCTVYTFGFKYRNDAALDYPTSGYRFDANGTKTPLTANEMSQLQSGMTGWNSFVRTDVFGTGFVVAYDKPIMDDAKNPNGIDFVIYGNAFAYANGGSGEPAGVQVSQDGENWYTLAGSKHFDDTTDWTRACGTNGQTSLLLAKSGENGITSSAPAVTFGYADIHSSTANENGESLYPITGKAGNPYAPSHISNIGDGFDLAWAVDAQGNRVSLAGGIRYIKIQNVVDINHPGFGLCNAEIGGVVRAVNTNENVGVTSAPQAIVVDGEPVLLKDNVYQYEAEADGTFAVHVDAPQNTNIIINGNNAAELSFDAIPRHKSVRIILQEGEKQPLIYDIKLIQNVSFEKVEKVRKLIEALPNTEKLTLADADAVKKAKTEFDALGTLTKKLPQALIDRLNVAIAQMEKLQIPTDLAAVMSATGTYLYSSVSNPVIATTGGEWTVIGLARAQYDVSSDYYARYLANVLRETAEKKGVLHTKKYTEYSRVVLALSAIGYDVTDVAGYNLLTPLADYDKVVWQGINGPIWALTAFDAHGYEIPPMQGSGKQSTRENLIAAILTGELAGGGWALSGNNADADMTAMALFALAPYCDKNAAVQAAVERGLHLLSTVQNAAGGFGSLGVDNAESCAQVIMALSALKIDAATDARFIKNGKTALDALCAYAVDGGGFKHIPNGNRDGMATEQGYCALVAYDRMLKGKTALYAMSDVTISAPYQATVKMIDAIGAVNLEKTGIIRAARAAYDALDAAQKAKVKNYDVLLTAEKTLAALLENINRVKSLIDGIGEVTLASETQIKLARESYNALSDSEKSYITNLSVLTRSEKRLAQLKNAGAVMNLIADIGTVTKDSAAKINAARSAYNALSAEEKAMVNNYTLLTSAERKLESLNPTGGTKVIGPGQAGILLNGKKYIVDKASAAVMEKIKKITAAGTYSDAEIVEIYRQYEKLTQKQKGEIINFADLEAQMNRIGVANHTDKASGITIEGADWHVKLQVSPQKNDSDTYVKLSGAIGSNTLVLLWDISLSDLLTGKECQLEKPLTLRMPAPDLTQYDSVMIAHVRADNTIEYINCEVIDGEIVWQVNTFSYYGVIGCAKAAQRTLPDETSAQDTSIAPDAAHENAAAPLPWLWIVIAAVGFACVILAIIFKKRSRI